MAVIPIYSSISSKYQVSLSTLKRHSGLRTTSDDIVILKMPLCFCSVSGDSKLHLLNHTSFPNKRKIKHKAKGVEKDTPHLFLCASKSINNGRQLKTLDSYFSKLKKETTLVPSRDSEPKIMGPPSKSLDETMKLVDEVGQFKTRKAMSSLEDYLGKLKAVDLKNNGTASEDKISEENPTRTLYSDNGDHGKSVQKSMTSYTQLGSKDVELGLENTEGLQSSYESSDAYLVSMLASINIAVFLFEIASPVRNSGIEILSLPSLYGAKINELILVGEWWRLVTPMFLHSGVLHVSLSCWVLLTFGPQVCKGYGSWTFFLIYLLGGISGNMTSFIHTSETTVGGTGPVFAIIGAWLIYQIQNKGVIAKKVSESLFQKAVIATALSFVLSTFGLIDDWTHLGAVCTGIAYGYLTCPTLQLDNASSKTGQEDGVAVVRRYADPCKSVIAFAVFIAILSSLLLFVESQELNFL